MPKVLSQAGTSLADSYDILGSVAGIDQLHTKEVQVVHELGQTITMERMQARIFTMITAATIQDTAFAISLTPLTASPARIYGIVVTVDVTSRLTHVNVSARDPVNGTEMPLWVWDGANEDVIRFSDGTALANQIVLRPTVGFYNPLPLTMYGIDLPENHVNQYRLRGLTSGFGAGEVTVTAQMYAAFIDGPGALSSRGIPVPSW